MHIGKYDPKPGGKIVNRNRSGDYANIGISQKRTLKKAIINMLMDLKEKMDIVSELMVILNRVKETIKKKHWEGDVSKMEG